MNLTDPMGKGFSVKAPPCASCGHPWTRHTKANGCGAAEFRKKERSRRNARSTTYRFKCPCAKYQKPDSAYNPDPKTTTYTKP